MTAETGGPYNPKRTRGLFHAETHIPTQKTPARQGPWVSRPLQYLRRPGYLAAAAVQGASRADSLKTRPQLCNRGMQQRSRLTGSKRFSQIHRHGSGAANRLLVIRYLPNGLEQSRFGFVTSKRIGNAVVRNRVKRRLREAVRASRVKCGWDAVFIARKGSGQAGYQELRRAALSLLRRGHLVEAEDRAAGSTAETGARS